MLKLFYDWKYYLFGEYSPCVQLSTKRSLRVAARAHIVADGELSDAATANVLAAAYPAIAYMEMRGDLMRPLIEGIGVCISDETAH